MPYETVSEEGWPDYEIFTCPTCGHQVCLNGVGNDIDCPQCIAREEAEPPRWEREEANDYGDKKE